MLIQCYSDSVGLDILPADVYKAKGAGEGGGVLLYECVFERGERETKGEREGEMGFTTVEEPMGWDELQQLIRQGSFHVSQQPTA
jgi:hypothetical protein